mmetsp:Transcript_43655/g.102658  ORF Transcript_43655/g.102658 Transcript_43655/m.102658 type:complete len:103 (-) Transcript_43655:101-409(-)
MVLLSLIQYPLIRIYFVKAPLSVLAAIALYLVLVIPAAFWLVFDASATSFAPLYKSLMQRCSLAVWSIRRRCWLRRYARSHSPVHTRHVELTPLEAVETEDV